MHPCFGPTCEDENMSQSDSDKDHGQESSGNKELLSAPGETLTRLAIVLAAVAAGSATVGNVNPASSVNELPSFNREEIKQLVSEAGMKLTLRTQSGAIVDAVAGAKLQDGEQVAQGGYSKVHQNSGGHQNVGGYTFKDHDGDENNSPLVNWTGDVFLTDITPAELEKLKSTKLNIRSQGDIDILKKFTDET